jgi:hypothetical protein
MVDKKDIKEKIRKIYEALPKLDDQQCGYRSCGEFATAVAEGKAACYGCITGGPEVATKVCEIMEAPVPQDAIAQFGPSPGSYRARLGVGAGMSPGLGRGRDMGRRWARGRRGGMGRGFGRGWRGRCKERNE